MRLSQLFTKTSKDFPSDESSKNAQLLIRAGYVHKAMSGVYAYLPLGLKVLGKIENIVRKHMNSIGGQEILMNSLHPKSWWDTTNRWSAENVDVLFRLQSQTQSEYALACSHEEQVTPIAKNYIKSWKDLPEFEPKSSLKESQFPLAVYQIQTKFRDELRSKSGLLRGREFRMKDMYDFHRTQESATNYYNLVKETYLKIYEEMGLKAFAVRASGGMFTENDSHEFQVICEAGEDEILYSEEENFAINVEMLEKMQQSGAKIPENLQRGVSAEVGNIFMLGDKYTKAFGLTYTDQNNQAQTPIMNCHGIGTSRCLGVLAEIYSDEKGLKWPQNIAPFKFHLITHLDKDEQINQQILALASDIYTQKKKLLVSRENEIEKLELIDPSNLADLTKFTISDLQVSSEEEVLFDDRAGVSLGEKLKDADLIGCCYQIIISKRSLESGENGGIEVKKR